MAKKQSLYNMRYDEKNRVKYTLNVNLKYDSDIYAILSVQENVQAYIKRLIREDIDRAVRNLENGARYTVFKTSPTRLEGLTISENHTAEEIADRMYAVSPADTEFDEEFETREAMQAYLNTAASSTFVKDGALYAVAYIGYLEDSDGAQPISISAAAWEGAKNA